MRCTKPGCEAKAIVGRPCVDYDCPQRFVRIQDHDVVQSFENSNEVNIRILEELRQYTQDATKALVSLTIGGSEFFGKRISEVYTADIPRCLQNIKKLQESQKRLAYLKGKHSRKVKELVWEGELPTKTAECGFGLYFIKGFSNDTFGVEFDEQFISFHEHEEDAKEAANVDFRRRLATCYEE